MDSGFIVTLVAYAILVMLVAERNGIVTQDMGGNALALERLITHGDSGIERLEKEASGRFLNCHGCSIAEIWGNCKLYFAFLFAFVGDEKGLEEAAIIAERCDPSLALGACASELLILRPLMVNNVAVCFGGLFLGGLFFDGSFVFFEGHESIIADHTPNASPKWPFYSFFLPRNSLSIKELRARGRAFPVTR